jgi:hypothetical protein
LGQLIKVITASCSPENVANASNKFIGPDQGEQNHSATKPEILLNICELLCFCVLHHPYRIKYIFVALQNSELTMFLIIHKFKLVLFTLCRCSFLLNNVIDKILLLTRRGEKYLVVGAIRFVRTILSRHVSSYVCVDTISVLSLATARALPLYIYISIHLPRECNYNYMVHKGLTALSRVKVVHSSSPEHCTTNFEYCVFVVYFSSYPHLHLMWVEY